MKMMYVKYTPFRRNVCTYIIHRSSIFEIYFRLYFNMYLFPCRLELTWNYCRRGNIHYVDVVEL